MDFLSRFPHLKLKISLRRSSEALQLFYEDFLHVHGLVEGRLGQNPRFTLARAVPLELAEVRYDGYSHGSRQL